MPRPHSPKEHFTEANVPSHLKLVVSHLHDGNTDPEERVGPSGKPAKYATVAKLFRRDDGDLVAMGYSYCSKKDVPSRKVGRMVAIGRALKEYYQPVPF